MTPELSESDAARFRAFERTRYHALAESYDHFFAPVTANAIAPLLKGCLTSPAVPVRWRRLRTSRARRRPLSTSLPA